MRNMKKVKKINYQFQKIKENVSLSISFINRYMSKYLKKNF